MLSSSTSHVLRAQFGSTGTQGRQAPMVCKSCSSSLKEGKKSGLTKPQPHTCLQVPGFVPLCSSYMVAEGKQHNFMKSSAGLSLSIYRSSDTAENPTGSWEHDEVNQSQQSHTWEAPACNPKRRTMGTCLGSTLHSALLPAQLP